MLIQPYFTKRELVDSTPVFQLGSFLTNGVISVVDLAFPSLLWQILNRIPLLSSITPSSATTRAIFRVTVANSGQPARLALILSLLAIMPLMDLLRTI
jgi:hypothetical protein